MTQLPLPHLPLARDTLADKTPHRLSAYRRRLQRVAMQAYRLAEIRTEQRLLAEPVPRSLSSAAVHAEFAMHDAPVSATRLLADERAVLGELAKKLDRVAPSHKFPERYFEAKSEIVHTLRRLSRG